MTSTQNCTDCGSDTTYQGSAFCFNCAIVRFNQEYQDNRRFYTSNEDEYYSDADSGL